MDFYSYTHDSGGRHEDEGKRQGGGPGHDPSQTQTRVPMYMCVIKGILLRTNLTLICDTILLEGVGYMFKYVMFVLERVRSFLCVMHCVGE